MPGLVGFTVTSALADMDNLDALRKMRGSLAHQPFHVQGRLFYDNNVYASQIFTDQRFTPPDTESVDGVHVWLDGEIYNQRELGACIDRPVRSDAELLSCLYSRSGDFSFLSAIDGIYSAVIYDSHERRLYLITDRYGLRPIYFHVGERSFSWMSELKAVLELSRFRPVIDPEAVDEFVNKGRLSGERTWFEDVECVPAACILCWDLRGGELSRKYYWSWNEIQILQQLPPEKELAEELGRLFLAAVEKRWSGCSEDGLFLSGGLDSRAILAAIPPSSCQVHAVTFGKRGAPDVMLAARAAAVRDAAHHVFEIGEFNWLPPRIRGIWWSDGQLSLLHMHGIEALPKVRELFAVNISGFAGDLVLGGSYAGAEEGETAKIQQRVRRFTRLGLEISESFIESRLPFYDNDLIEFAFSIPERERRALRLYKEMLLLRFPEYFGSIPWQRTGISINAPEIFDGVGRQIRRIRNKMAAVLRCDSLRSDHRYTDYDNWIRMEPSRSLFDTLLTSRDALYPRFLSRDRVIGEWRAHLSGRDNAQKVCQFITLEVWLQQVFEGRFRDEGNLSEFSSRSSLL